MRTGKLQSVVLMLALGAAQLATAAMINVTSTADDGSPGTLRAALASAADGDTINITATGTIALTSELAVEKSVTITGPGRDQLTVDGQSATRVFFVWSDATVPTVTISGLTIANGKSAATGGGVHNGGTLTLRDCTLSDNYAREGGGGVYTENGSLVITRCTLSGNTADFVSDYDYGGGAVAFLARGSSPTLTIESSLLTGNTASHGGGIIIYVDGVAEFPAHVSVTVTNCTLSNNTAAFSYAFGGAIAVSVEGYDNPEAASATVTVENSTLSGNSAVGDSMALGGAIGTLTYNGGNATLIVKNSTLNGNSSSHYGGAIFNNGTLNLVNSTLNGNSGSGGGAVHALGVLTLTDCALSGNIASVMGGAIMSGLLDARLNTALTITRCTLNNNTVAANGIGGGAIINLGVGATASLTIADSTLSANSASGGGAILTAGVVYYAGEFEWEPEFPGTATVNIKNSTLSGNSAQDGGGIANWKGRQDCSATLTVDNSTLSGNWADDTFAGAVANVGGMVGIKNTILAAGPTGANLRNDGDLGGTIVSFGSNLSSEDGGGFLTATGDLINTDPKLGALANNGGPTWTCALQTDSPAINAGSATDSAGNTVTNDQRGVTRPQGSGNDIGAFEVEAAVNHPPVADAGADQNLTVPHDGNPATSTVAVSLNGSGSSDPDGDALTYLWQKGANTLGTTATLAANLATGTHTISLTVTDTHGATAADEVVVAVAAEPNAAPTANAGPDQTVGTTGNSAPVTLTGAGSSDPDGDALTYAWTENGNTIASGASPSIVLAAGTHTITLTVTDSYGTAATDVLVVTVRLAYSWSGVLQPIDPPNANGVSASVFKSGSTVPVKFALTGASAGITTLAATLSYAKISSGIVGSDIEALSTAAATTGNLFRYDAASGQYIFNWSTKGLDKGTYRLFINLGDGVSRTVDLGLK